MAAMEWEGAWPVGAVGEALGGARTPLRALADDMRSTLAHANAFPNISSTLRAEVRDVNALVELAQRDVVVAVVDWRHDAAGEAPPSTDADEGFTLGCQLLCGDGDGGGGFHSLPAGVRVEMVTGRGALRTWQDFDVLVLVMDSAAAAEGQGLRVVPISAQLELFCPPYDPI
jgi:hypothetical protein